jgi:hypothetical protein
MRYHVTAAVRVVLDWASEIPPLFARGSGS